MEIVAGPVTVNTDRVTLRRLYDAWWLPRKAAGDGGSTVAADYVGVGGDTNFGFGAIDFTAPGVAPQWTLRGMRCCILRPTLGTSRVRLYMSWSWLPLLQTPGARGALVRGLPTRIRSWNVAADLRRESTAAKGIECGLQITADSGVIQNLSDPAVIGFGVVGNGGVGAAAGWRFVMRAAPAGALTVDFPIPVVGDARDWKRYRIEGVDADPAAGTDGSVTVYENEVPLLTVSTPALLPWVGDVAGATGYDVSFIDAGPNADTLTFARLHEFIDSVPGSIE